MCSSCFDSLCLFLGADNTVYTAIYNTDYYAEWKEDDVQQYTIQIAMLSEKRTGYIQQHAHKRYMKDSGYNVSRHVTWNLPTQRMNPVPQGTGSLSSSSFSILACGFISTLHFTAFWVHDLLLSRPDAQPDAVDRTLKNPIANLLLFRWITSCWGQNHSHIPINRSN